MVSRPMASSTPTMAAHPVTTTPSYGDFLVHSYSYMRESIQYGWSGKYTSQRFAQDLALLAQSVTLLDLLVVTALSIFLTAARHYSTKYIFKPITVWRGISVHESGKIPESAWKLTFYLTTWTLAAYLIFGRPEAQYFRHPERVWENYSVYGTVDGGIYALYAIELGFYIHSLYTTLLVDQRRKDTTTLMVHHIICILLLAISYCNRSHKSGLLTLFLHDGSDVILEATKLVRYFKVQHGRTYNWVESIVNIGFACFLLTWISNRLYWFPLKQVYMASIYVESKAIQVPFISLLIGMLWIILFMNYYWFSFALRLLYKVARGQLSELEDNREFKEESTESDEETLADGSKAPTADEEVRKLSVDSGVLILEGSDGNESDKSAESEETGKREKEDNGESVEATEEEEEEEEAPQSAPGSPSSYNLRQRRGINFSMYR